MNYCVLLVGSVNERIIFSFVMNDQYRLASFLLIIVNAAKIKEQEEEAYEQQASHLTAYKYTTRDYKHIRNSKITKLVVYKMCFVVFNLWLSTYLNLLSFRWVISFLFLIEYNESRHNMLIREWHHFCTVSFWLHWPPTSINALSHRYSLSLSYCSAYFSLLSFSRDEYWGAEIDWKIFWIIYWISMLHCRIKLNQCLI